MSATPKCQLEPPGSLFQCGRAFSAGSSGGLALEGAEPHSGTKRILEEWLVGAGGVCQVCRRRRPMRVFVSW